LNLYNISTHFNRHVEQKDIREVEAIAANVKHMKDKCKQQEAMLADND